MTLLYFYNQVLEHECLQLIFIMEAFVLIFNFISALVFLLYSKTSRSLNTQHEFILNFLFFKKKRSIWNKLKLYYLTFTLLMPNYVYVFKMPLLLSGCMLFILGLLAPKIPFLYLILGLKVYYVFSSFFFGLFYDKSSTFKFFFTKIFFEGNINDSEKVIHYFFGNPLTKAFKLIGTGAVISKVGQYQWSSEVAFAKAESRNACNWAINASPGKSKADEMTAQALHKWRCQVESDILGDQPLHAIQGGIINVTKAAVEIVKNL